MSSFFASIGEAARKVGQQITESEAAKNASFAASAVASSASATSNAIAQSEAFQKTKSLVSTAAVAVVDTASSLKPAPIIRLRPTWGVSFGSCVAVLRTTAYSISRDVKTIRLLTDHGIPSWLPTLPKSIKCEFSKTRQGEWFYPVASNFSPSDFEGLNGCRGGGEEEEGGGGRGGPTAINQDWKFILYFHGGAFCCCDTSTHRGLLFRLSEATQTIIFAVDYKRPPEFPFPAPITDCLSAYAWLIEQGVSALNIVFAGDSAGGGLVASCMLATSKFRRSRPLFAHHGGGGGGKTGKGEEGEEGEDEEDDDDEEEEEEDVMLPRPAGGILLSPWVDLEETGVSSSWQSNEAFDYLPQDLSRLFAECYKGLEASWDDVSPAHAADCDLAMLPPLLVACGECEVLHDQIASFVAKLRANLVDVDFIVEQDMVHVYPLFAFTGQQQSLSFFDQCLAFTQKVFAY